jgi:hypothetical protein
LKKDALIQKIEELGPDEEAAMTLISESDIMLIAKEQHVELTTSGVKHILAKIENREDNWDDVIVGEMTEYLTSANALDIFIGKKMKVLWYDDPTRYVGVVEKTESGHQLICKELEANGATGYLEDAQEFEEMKDGDN